jgi:hypothetical protein
MPFAFAVVCEAAADFRTATGLVERIIREQVDWVDQHLLDNCPLWRGTDEARPYLLWSEVPKLAEEAGIPPIRGNFDGRPAEPDARTALRALRLLKLKNAGRQLDGVLLIRDDDRDTRRRTGLEQGRDAEHELRDRVVIGLAHCKRECWVLAGFDPAHPDEEDRLAAVRAELGFDPRIGAHQLTAKHDADRRSAKRVLGVLTQDDADREEFCWKEAPLATLRERGRETGLVEFLDEVSSRIVPVFPGYSPS